MMQRALSDFCVVMEVRSARRKSFPGNASCCTNHAPPGNRTRGSLDGKQVPYSLSEYLLHMNCVLKVTERAQEHVDVKCK
jgi:hypothetical protein